jgi:hypothetical protein
MFLLLLLLLLLLLCLLLLLPLLLLRVPLTAASKLLIPRALLLLPLPLPRVCPRSSIVCPHRFLFVLEEPKVVLLTIEADFTDQRSRTARVWAEMGSLFAAQSAGQCSARQTPGAEPVAVPSAQARWSLHSAHVRGCCLDIARIPSGTSTVGTASTMHDSE